MGRRRVSVVAGLGLGLLQGSCGSSQPANDTPSLAVTLAPPRASTPSEPTAAPPPTGDDRLSVSRPAAIACEVAHAGSLSRFTEIGLSTRGPAAAVLSNASAWRVFIAEGEAEDGIVVEAEAGEVFVRGVATPDALPLHVDRVAVLSEVVAPWPRAHLVVSGGGADGIAVEMALPAEVDLASGERHVRGRVPCSIVALEVGEFDPFETLLGAPIDDGELVGGRIGLTVSPAGGAIVAALAPSSTSDRRVSVLGRDKKRVKIAWDFGDGVVFGWTDARHVRPVQDAGDSFGAGGLGLSGGSLPSWRVAKCRADVPVELERDRGRGTIGILRAGKTVRVLDESSDGWTIELPSGALAPKDGATLRITPQYVPKCEEIVTGPARPRF